MLDFINTFQLGYSLDKVYQVGIAESVNLKCRRTDYARFDATNLEPAPTLKPVQCVFPIVGLQYHDIEHTRA